MVFRLVHCFNSSNANNHKSIKLCIAIQMKGNNIDVLGERVLEIIVEKLKQMSCLDIRLMADEIGVSYDTIISIRYGRIKTQILETFLKFNHISSKSNGLRSSNNRADTDCFVLY